jgi:hypothetical protein
MRSALISATNARNGMNLCQILLQLVTNSDAEATNLEKDLTDPGSDLYDAYLHFKLMWERSAKYQIFE